MCRYRLVEESVLRKSQAEYCWQCQFRRYPAFPAHPNSAQSWSPALAAVLRSRFNQWTVNESNGVEDNVVPEAEANEPDAEPDFKRAVLGGHNSRKIEEALTQTFADRIAQTPYSDLPVPNSR